MANVKGDYDKKANDAVTADPAAQPKDGTAVANPDPAAKPAETAPATPEEPKTPSAA